MPASCQPQLTVSERQLGGGNEMCVGCEHDEKVKCKYIAPTVLRRRGRHAVGRVWLIENLQKLWIASSAAAVVLTVALSASGVL